MVEQRSEETPPSPLRLGPLRGPSPQGEGGGRSLQPELYSPPLTTKTDPWGTLTNVHDHAAERHDPVHL